MNAVLTDSACDLGPVLLSSLGLVAVPLTVRLQGHSYRDWQDLDPDILYDQMRAGAEPGVQPPDLEQLCCQYQALLEEHEQVLSIHVSSRLCDVAAVARQAADAVGGGRVTVLDSGVASAPQAELAMLAARLTRAGLGSDEVLARVEALRGQLTCEYSAGVGGARPLSRSLGRAKRSTVLHFEDGALAAGRRAQGAVLDDMIQELLRRYGAEPIHVTLSHAGRDYARTEQIRKALEGSDLLIRSGRIQLIGATLGRLLGAGAVGLVAYPNASDGSLA